jgi:hypothetical protein
VCGCIPLGSFSCFFFSVPSDVGGYIFFAINAGLKFSLVGLRFCKTFDLRYQQFLSGLEGDLPLANNRKNAKAASIL